LSVAQKRAMEQGMPRWGIEYHPEALDLTQAFGRQASKILEIGFGMGAASAEIAKQCPENDYLGIEVHSPGVGNLLKLIDEHALTNLRLIRHDAVEVIDHMLPADSLDGAHIFFPDPWPKKRHHKRRLIQPELIAKLAGKLRPGGYLHAATDWEEYAQQILEVFSACPQLENSAASALDTVSGISFSDARSKVLPSREPAAATGRCRRPIHTVAPRARTV